MPVEIRELIIKASFESRTVPAVAADTAALDALRRDILEQCERMLREHQAGKALER